METKSAISPHSGPKVSANNEAGRSNTLPPRVRTLKDAAHEINNLMTVILGTADSIIEDFGWQPALRAQVTTIIDAVDSGTALVRHLQDIAENQSPEPISRNEWTGSAIQMTHAAPPVNASARTLASVLLVEDDDLIRFLTAEKLRSLGYSVIAASDGPSALDIIRSSQRVDILFTDIVLKGGMNGSKLAVLAVAQCPGLKVLFTSGEIDPGTIRLAALQQVPNFLAKPYRCSDLADKIASILNSGASTKT